MPEPIAPSSTTSKAAIASRGERITTSYLLWALCFVGLAGAHRLYNGKIGTGLLWLLTWGLFGVGQMVDVFLVPDMAEERRLRLLRRAGLLAVEGSAPRAIPSQTVEPTREQRMVQMLQAARKHSGRLSVPLAVLETGLTFEQVEDLLSDMYRKGYVQIENDPETGAILYQFFGLS